MRFITLIPLLIMLAACSAVTSNNAQGSIETTAQLALTSELAVLKRPCTDTVTTLCITADTATKLRAARIVLWDSLKAYRAASDAYKVAGTDDAKAAVKSTYAALLSAIGSADDVLALEEVQAVLKSMEE